MKLKGILFDDVGISKTLTRISHEILEKNKGTDDLVLVGVEQIGLILALNISKILYKLSNVTIPVSSILCEDIIFSENKKFPTPELKVEITDKKVIIVEDVMITGRTAVNAITHIIKRGWPKKLQIATLIASGHRREMPVLPDYVGKNIPTTVNETIFVKVKELDKESCVKIYIN